MSFDDLLGVPYKDHGRDKNGYDCYGLAIEAARRFGYKLDDVIYDDHALELSDEYKPTLNVTPIDKPRAGALIEMKCGDELHVGICINSREFIHIPTWSSSPHFISINAPARGLSMGVTLSVGLYSSLNSSAWSSYITSSSLYPKRLAASMASP